MRRGIHKGDGFGARERDLQFPLCRLLFALFLPKQEKGITLKLHPAVRASPDPTAPLYSLLRYTGAVDSATRCRACLTPAASAFSGPPRAAFIFTGAVPKAGA